MANRTIGSSALKDDYFERESDGKFEKKIPDNVVNIDDFRNPIEKKINEISRQTRELLDGSDDFEVRVKEKIKAIIREDEVKTKKEEIEDLAESMAKEIGFENKSDIKVEAKKIRLEIEKWQESNSGQIKNFRKEEFKKKFVEETKKLNPDIKQEELNKAREYGEMISDVYADESIVDKQKDEALEANSGYGPGKLENSWTDLRGITEFLTKKPEEIKDIKNKYESAKDGLRNVNLPNIKENRSFENVISTFNNQGVSSLFSKTQGHLGWADRVNTLTGGWLNKTMSKVGGQLADGFAKNSLNVLAEQGFSKGFSTIMSGILSGGVKAAGSAAVTGVATGAATGAVTAAGTVAAGAATGGIGLVVAAALGVLKKVKDVLGKLAEKIGIGSKKFLEENFGKFGGAVIEGAGFLIGLPLLLIGAISAVVVAPLLILVLGGLFGYQMFMGNSVSSLVPPSGSNRGGSSGYITEPYTGTYITSSGSISLPEVIPGVAVTGQMVVDMARSLVNKVCYYYGGGHDHFWPHEPEKGIGLYWGSKTYVDAGGVTKTFGDNTQFGSDNSRTVYGLDCSGFVGWVYHQFGIDPGWWGAESQYNISTKVTSNELQIGDLGFTSDAGHVGIFAGRDSSGNAIWIHDGSGSYLDICQGQKGFVKEGTYSGFVKYGRIL